MSVPRGRPGPKRTLTEREILDAALALLDAGGSQAASIRRIAAAVNMAPNAVYTYFPDKAAVEHAIVERLLGEVAEKTRLDRAASWRDGVETLALELRRRLIAHPGVVPLLLSGPIDGHNARRLGECLIVLLESGGLGSRAAARATYLITAFILGSVAFEVSDTPHLGSLQPEATRIAARRVVLGDIPPASFPRTAAAAGVLAESVGTEQYVWSLRRLLDGLAAPGVE